MFAFANAGVYVQLPCKLQGRLIIYLLLVVTPGRHDLYSACVCNIIAPVSIVIQMTACDDTVSMSA